MRLFLCCLLLPLAAAAQTLSPVNQDITRRVNDLVGRMTLEEKVGQMTQLTIDVVSAKAPDGSLAEPHRVDQALLEQVIGQYHVGSILNVGGHTYPRAHWYEIMAAVQAASAKTRLKIPVLYGIDAIHGTNYTDSATLFPQQIALAATWNPAFAREMGQITAYETRASAIPWTFSPVLDLGRNPLWPRFWETFGEDPCLASAMGVALTQGYQGNDLASPVQVAACLKHFVGYSFPLSGKDRTPAWIPERQLREYFLPTFEAAIQAGAVTLMINSGEMNGIPVHSDPAILTDLLRKELGFQGIAVTDWEDIKYLYSRHHVAKDYREAIKMAINAGVDMSMVPLDVEFPQILVALVKSGEVPESRINEAVSRILQVKFQLGLFEKLYHPAAAYPEFASANHTRASYTAACEAITLLKNEQNLLPLPKTARVLVTGPTAHSLNALNGGWTHTWQGAETKYNTPGKLTVLQAIEAHLGKAQVRYLPGATTDSLIAPDAVVAAAREVDAVVVCLGEMPYTEKPGDIHLLDLPQAQQALVAALKAAGKPVVLVLLQGRPRVIREAEPHAQAILLGYLPGNEGGRAIADVLFGTVNPSGKLPFTYPRFANDLVPYDHKWTEELDANFSDKGFAPQWPFGFGLSYTTFAYGDLALSGTQIATDKPLTVSITVTNTGKRAGSEVVQCYTSDLVASITPSVKRLRKFEKIVLQPGESRTVSFTLTVQDLSFINRENRRVTESGDFTVEIGGKKAAFSMP